MLIEFPDDPMMRVSHETIYQSIYVQRRGQLSGELARCLRTGRVKRRPQGGVERRGRIPGMVMISERPAEADELRSWPLRRRPGHRQGGPLRSGHAGRADHGHLLLLHLPTGKEAEKVDAAIRHALTKVPAQFFRTLTWDQGKEMAKHVRFTTDTGVQVYFCDPHSPWQRPSNENTNGLLRQYMPKGAVLSLVTEAELRRHRPEPQQPSSQAARVHETI